jgi:hypothetical protein
VIERAPGGADAIFGAEQEALQRVRLGVARRKLERPLQHLHRAQGTAERKLQLRDACPRVAEFRR